MSLFTGVRSTARVNSISSLLPALQNVPNLFSFTSRGYFSTDDERHSKFGCKASSIKKYYFSSCKSDGKYKISKKNSITGAVNSFHMPSSTFCGASFTNTSPPANSSPINSSYILTQTTRSLSMSSGEDENFLNGKPTLAYARTIPKKFSNLSNEMVLHFYVLGVPEACRECVVRDIMSVDNVEYDEAMKVFKQIEEDNRELIYVFGFPFKIGFALAFTGGIVSFPLVFDESTMVWFNHNFVTADLPPPEDMETFLEIGSASWGWMEPILGQISFFLLCMQFARAQLSNLGIRPYFNWQRQYRANRLVAKYPRYDAEFLEAYSKSIPLMQKGKLAD